MSKDIFSGLPPELQDLMDVDKEFSKIGIRVEKRKYGKLWGIVSGIEGDAKEMKKIVKIIKNRLACGGTIKGKEIEVLFGRHDRTNDLIDVLVSEGFSRDAIHVTGGR